jgi:hypothetical protein
MLILHHPHCLSLASFLILATFRKVCASSSFLPVLTATQPQHLDLTTASIRIKALLKANWQSVPSDVSAAIPFLLLSMESG